MKWLNSRNIPFPTHAKRLELLLICKQNWPKPVYMVDNVIRDWRLPPAHPELNAIEQVWGFMKRQVRSSLQRFTRADLYARIEEARIAVTREIWAGAIRRSRSFEEDYWSSDNIHDRVDPVIIDIDSDGEDDLFIDSEDD